MELARTRATAERLWNRQADGNSERRLLLVKRVEGIGLKNEGTGNLQHVKRASAQKRSVRSRDLLRLVVGSGGKRDDLHNALLDIFAKETVDFLHFRGPQLLSVEPQSDGVEDFDFSHVGKEQRQDRAFYPGRGQSGIHVENVEGEQEAGVDTGGQKRSSRSNAMISAPETFMRFLPKIFFRRARKSGRRTRTAGLGGSRRAMTRLRLVMWISSPSRRRSSTAEKRYRRSRTEAFFM